MIIMWWIEASANTKVVIILQYISVSNQHVLCLKCIQYYLSIFISKNKIVSSGGTFKIISSNTIISADKETLGLRNEVTSQTFQSVSGQHSMSTLLSMQFSLLLPWKMFLCFHLNQRYFEINLINEMQLLCTDISPYWSQKTGKERWKAECSSTQTAKLVLIHSTTVPGTKMK